MVSLLINKLEVVRLLLGELGFSFFPVALVRTGSYCDFEKRMGKEKVYRKEKM